MKVEISPRSSVLVWHFEGISSVRNVIRDSRCLFGRDMWHIQVAHTAWCSVLTDYPRCHPPHPTLAVVAITCLVLNVTRFFHLFIFCFWLLVVEWWDPNQRTLSYFYVTSMRMSFVWKGAQPCKKSDLLLAVSWLSQLSQNLLPCCSEHFLSALF